MKRRTLVAAAGLVPAALSSLLMSPAARAQNARIVFGYTAVTDFTSVFVAAEEGFFKKRNLDVELNTAVEIPPDTVSLDITPTLRAGESLDG